MLESALLVLVPQAEGLRRAFRDRYDPQAVDDIPAHVTLLYPFKHPATIEAADLAKLRRCFASFAPFSFALTALRRFDDGTFYLAPEPDEPFRRLTLAIWQEYPRTPPYQGKHPQIVPHLTLVRAAAGVRLSHRDVAATNDLFTAAGRPALPIAARAEEVTLMDTGSGRWEVRNLFSLGGGAVSPPPNG